MPHASADQLRTALRAFDWDGARSLCREIARRVWAQPDWIDERAAAQMLGDLRAKRQFASLERLAEAFLLAGLSKPRVLRQYAQALIDQGRFAGAECVLQSLLTQPGAAAEHMEARGLLGRLYKQLYVNPGEVGTPGVPQFLGRALTEYWQAYAAHPAMHYWHGINVVALLARAAQDGVPVPPHLPPMPVLARQLLVALGALDAARAGGLAAPAYERATRLEAHVALGELAAAVRDAAEYVRCADADAFEIASTERQLREVWRLDANPDPEAGRVLAILRAMLLAQQGGQVTVAQSSAGPAVGAADDAAASPALEAILGATAFRTLAWYRQGLDCCAGVVRIETRTGRGFGTGWIVDGASLSAAWAGRTLVVTNKHVVSPSVNGGAYIPQPGRRALLPGDAVIFHELSNTRVPVTDADVVWTSPDLDLDATVLALQTMPAAARVLAVSGEVVALADPPDRVYVIGHPDGRGLEFSLQDNVMLDCDARRLHYRAPTEGGSSGSPVFDAEWRVIAIHHAGGRGLRRLDGTGRYDANEGIAIAALRAAL